MTRLEVRFAEDADPRLARAVVRTGALKTETTPAMILLRSGLDEQSDGRPVGSITTPGMERCSDVQTRRKGRASRCEIAPGRGLLLLLPLHLARQRSPLLLGCVELLAQGGLILVGKGRAPLVLSRPGQRVVQAWTQTRLAAAA